MKKEKMYRYLGKNGMITTHVELLDIAPLPMIKLSSKADYKLSNGEETAYSVTVFPEDEDKWFEIPDPEKEKNSI